MSWSAEKLSEVEVSVVTKGISSNCVSYRLQPIFFLSLPRPAMVREFVCIFQKYFPRVLEIFCPVFEMNRTDHTNSSFFFSSHPVLSTRHYFKYIFQLSYFTGEVNAYRIERGGKRRGGMNGRKEGRNLLILPSYHLLFAVVMVEVLRVIASLGAWSQFQGSASPPQRWPQNYSPLMPY